MRFLLSDRTANALRSVAAKEGIEPDDLVFMWCVAAGYQIFTEVGNDRTD
jgi:hypothetical protein